MDTQNPPLTSIRNICILSLSYWPFTPGHGETRHPKVISDLLNESFGVTIVTGHVAESKNKSILVEYEGTKKIIRIPFIRFKRKGILWRFLTNASFALDCLLAYRHISKQSIILTLSPDIPYFAITAPVLAFLKSSRHVGLLTDLFPDVAFDLGLFQGKAKREIVRSFCKRTYRNIYHIIVITESLRQGLINYGVATEKIDVIELAVDTERFRPRQVDIMDEDLPKIGNKFVVLYSGSFGKMYNFEIILQAAKAIEAFKDEIVFIIRGDGDQKEFIERMIKELELQNVLLLGTTSNTNLIISFINIASICVVPIRGDAQNIVRTLPSKIFEFWSCEKPVICTTSQGEPKELIDRSGAGMTIPPNDSKSLTEAIMYLFNNKSTLRKMGSNGRKLVEHEFSYDKIKEKLTQLFMRI
jgi:colanic acid biosynthesis glycosyl transferase WcaI